MELVPNSELRNALATNLNDWALKGDRLERTFEFSSFKLAMDFVSKVACVAEEVNHHPDITINYTKVKMELTSHDSGGITRRDLRMASRINEIAPELLNPAQLKIASL